MSYYYSLASGRMSWGRCQKWTSTWRRPGQSWSKRRLWQKVCWCWGRGIDIIMTTQQERTCSLFYWETQPANYGLITGNPKYFINCCLNEGREFQREREVVNNGEILPERPVTWGMYRDVTDWERVVRWVLFSGVLSPPRYWLQSKGLASACVCMWIHRKVWRRSVFQGEQCLKVTIWAEVRFDSACVRFPW